jgi:prevent-host-death family protein
MGLTTMSSREFNQDASKAKRAAEQGPVFITDRGRPSHVLMTIEEYQRITSSHTSIVDMLAKPGSEHIELEVTRFRGPLAKPPDLS